MVPIEALNVRICDYFGVPTLHTGAVLRPPAAASFEEETNGLTTTRSVNATCDQMAGAAVDLVTFASDTQQVSIIVPPCIGSATNGVLWARLTTKWVSEVRRYTP